MPLAATFPGKADFRAEAPESHGIFPLTAQVLPSLTPASAEKKLRTFALVDLEAPPPPFQATYGVFLI